MIVEEGCTVVGSELIPVLFDLCCEVEDDELDSVAESPLMWQFGAPVRASAYHHVALRTHKFLRSIRT